VPSLFIAGQDSRYWCCERADVAAESSPLATAVVPDFDQPDAMNAALLSMGKL
jgi:hypothetical protein